MSALTTDAPSEDSSWTVPSPMPEEPPAGFEYLRQSRPPCITISPYNNAIYKWYTAVDHTCDNNNLALEACQVLVVDLKLGHSIATTLLW